MVDKSHRHRHRHRHHGGHVDLVGHHYKIAFIGQPNVGKTTLYNSISGENREIGNWAGTTVEIGYTSVFHDGHRLVLVDLPGTYSLSGLSPEESVVSRYLETEKPDSVVIVTDVSALPRNLYLFLEVIEITSKVVLVVNMLDEAQRWGVNVDLDLLSRRMGVPVVGTVAIKGIGVDEVVDKAYKVALGLIRPKPIRIDYGPLEEHIAEIQKILVKEGIDHLSRWHAIKILLGDRRILKTLSPDSRTSILGIIEEARRALGEEPSKFIVSVRYKQIDDLLLDVFARRSLSDRVTEALDRLLLNSRLDAVISFLILGLTMYFAYQLGSWIYEAISLGMSDYFIPFVESLVKPYLPPIGVSFLSEAIFGGLDLVISFLPLIFMFTLALSFLENSGVIARLVLALDRFFAKFDSSGRSAIPLIMGTSCNVIGVTTARMVFSPKEKERLLYTIPFVQCSTRQAVLAVVLALVLPPLIAAALFITYIVLGFLIILLINRFAGIKGDTARVPTPIELPPYRLPPIRILNRISWFRAKHFLFRAGKVIILANIILWFLLNIPPGAPPDKTVVAYIGSILALPFSPIGFTWKEGVALLTGIMAKELTLGTLDLLYGGIQNIRIYLSLSSVIAFATVFAYYSPCFPTMETIRLESNRLKTVLKSVGVGLLVSSILGYLLYFLSTLIFFRGAI